MRSTRRERERERHREEILASALKVFCNRGYDNATMADIAEQAEFAVGTLYRFFDGKQTLHDALVVDAIRQTADLAVKAIERGGTPVEQIERYIDLTSGLYFTHRDVLRIYFSQTAGNYFAEQPSLAGEALDLHHRTRRKLATVFRDGIVRGLFAQIEPEMLVVGLHGVSDSIFSEVLYRPSEFTAEKVAELRKRLFLDPVRLKPRIRLPAQE